MQGVIFDFDGPIFDGRSASRDALTATFDHFESRFGRPEIALEGLPLYGPTALVALAYAELPNAMQALGEIRDFYHTSLQSRERAGTIDAGIRDLLRDLENRGVRRAILSSRKTAELVERLTHFGLQNAFDQAWGRDRGATAKPDPATLLALSESLNVPPAELVFIGDSDSDYDVTQGTGATYYHAAWTGEPAARAYTGCRILLRDVADMATVLRDTPRPSLSSHANMPANLTEAIGAGRLVFYAGAGVSVPSGIGGWHDHYLPLVRKLNVGPWMEQFDLPELLQLVASDAAQSEHVYKLFRQSFADRNPVANAYHYAMIRSGASHIWTTNYDRLFERAVDHGAFPHKTVKTDSQLLDSFDHSHLIIKMNGDFEDATYKPDLDWNLVVLEEQFDLAERRRREIWRLFEDDFRSSSIVFVGASFKDPALRRLLSNAAKSIPRTRFRHHLLIKAADHPGDRVIEAMHVANLKRVHIDTHLFASFADIERWVQQVTVIANRPIIGFSGTGKQTDGTLVPDGVLDGGTIDTRAIEQLCRVLGGALVHRGFRVTSGHGPGVGVPSVEAAFEADATAARYYLRRRGSSRFRRGAPAIVVGDEYAAMRRRFIGELDLLIAVGGDEKEAGISGTEAEIEMALERSIPVLILRQGGGNAARFKPQLLQKLSSTYPDPKLAAMVKTINQELDAIDPTELTGYASGKLIDRLADLVAVSLSATLRRPQESMQAQRAW